MKRTIDIEPAAVQALKIKCLVGASILLVLYFLRSFVFFTDSFIPVGMEECHTGAAAQEIVANGFQFPIEQYTPEFYENSIIVAVMMTAVSVRIMGLNQLSVEISPFVISFAVMLVFCSILIRGGFKSGLWFFIISYFFASGTFLYITMDSVGNHIFGLFMGAVVMSRFHRGHTTGRLRHFYAMMFAVGLGLFVHLASAMFAGICLIVYFIYKPAHSARPRLSAGETIKGVFFFRAGRNSFHHISI